MSKFQKYHKSPLEKPRPWDIHPVWRGIGCLLLLIIPVMAYAASVILVDLNATNGWLPSPYSLMRPIRIPFLGLLYPPLGEPIPHLWANLLVTVLLSLLGFALFVAFYSVIYSLIGPPRYGPLDAPPLRPPPRRRRR